MTISLAEAPGIGRLLSENLFIVPNHQRDYSWTDEQIEEFISDIITAHSEQRSSYFMGLMVFQVFQSNYTVLDGQQRLATAVILYSSIRRWLRQFEAYQQDADDIQRDYIGKRKLGGSSLNPKLSLNTANHQVFNDHIIQSSALGNVEAALQQLKKRDRNIKLLEAAIYVSRRVDEIAKIHNRGTDDAAKYFFSIIDYMRERVGVVKLIVPNDEMAYTVFETLNDRGLELSPLDLVKNHLFKHAAGHSSLRLQSLEERWAQMMQTLSSVRSDTFLKTFWTSRHGRIRTKGLFTELKASYNDDTSTNNLSIDLLSASEKYAALESADDPVWAPYSNDTRKIIRNLKIIGSQQVHPVMLSALEKFEPKEFERLMCLLEVCIVRYTLIVGGKSGNFETTCAILARKIYRQEIIKASAAHQELRGLYPSDSDFEKAFAIKEEDNGPKIQYFLKRLENEQRRRILGAMHKELEPGSLTVEHIYPKNPSSDWPRPQMKKEARSRLGNYCLLTEVNRSLGNKAFDRKRETYSSSELLLTKHLESYEMWDENAVEERQKFMAELARTAWSFQ